MEKRRYNLENIRKLLLRGFDEPELRRLCADTPVLQPVLDEFKKDMSKAELVDTLLDFAERRMEMEVLLGRAKRHNLQQYQKYGPYYEGQNWPEAAGPLGEEGIPALAPGSRMPLGRNPLFVGREEDLEALEKALLAGETVAATGMGGIGKPRSTNYPAKWIVFNRRNGQGH